MRESLAEGKREKLDRGEQEDKIGGEDGREESPSHKQPLPGEMG